MNTFRYLTLTRCLIVGLFLMNHAVVFAENQTGALVINGETASSNKLFLDFKDARLEDVLRTLSIQTGLNFVISEKLKDSKVSMYVEGVDPKEVLQAVLDTNRIIYEEVPDKKMILVKGRQAEGESPTTLITRVYKLSYLRVAAIKEIEAGTAGASSTAGGGFTFMTESKSEAREASSTSASDIKLIIESLLSSYGKLSLDDRSNSMIVTDVPDRFSRIEETIRQLDQPLGQVLIETYVVETVVDFDQFMGFEYGSTSEGQLVTFDGTKISTEFPFKGFGNLFFKDEKIEAITHGSSAATLTTVPGNLSFDSLDGVLKLLQTYQKVKILAKPRILVLDNEPALIKVTTNAAISTVTQTTSSPSASQASTTAERAETGIALRVTPLINRDGNVTLTLEPRVITTAASGVTVGTSSSLDPSIRSARSTLMLKDGMTVVMGGLISTQDTNQTRKVPILGDLPFVGSAFTRHKIDKQEKELIIFVTPHIVRDVSLVRAGVIPDERTAIDEDNLEFWKKPFQKKGPQGSGMKEENPDRYFDNRSSQIEQEAAKVLQKLKRRSPQTSNPPLLPRASSEVTTPKVRQVTASSAVLAKGASSEPKKGTFQWPGLNKTVSKKPLTDKKPLPKSNFKAGNEK